MLKTLHIKNLAIIDEVKLELGQGFTVLTGETGAGKSILLDGLSLVLGMRADPSLVRQGAEKAEVSAEFNLPAQGAAQRWLAHNELLDENEPTLCLIRRVVHTEGRTRAFVNGQAVNTGPLRELGDLLVNLYGQNESQTLMLASTQRELLDSYGGHTPALQAVLAAASEHQRLEQAIASAQVAARRDPAEVELLRHQVLELEAAHLQDGEAERLNNEHKRLANAGQLMLDGNRATELLSGSGDSGLDDLLTQASSLIASLSRLDPAFTEVEALITGAQAQVREAARLLSRQLDHLDQDPQVLAALEQRLASLHELARKHRVRIADLPQHHDQLATELAHLQRAGETIEALVANRDRALAHYRTVAATLSQHRRRAAATLADAASSEIRQLGMANAKLLVEVDAQTSGKVRSFGDDDVRFDFSANAGQAPRPLAKVASGGELSRVSLALQVALLQKRPAEQIVGTMVFDEVDAGIGGGVAEMVGKKLRQLGATGQALCVTHLAQVAAQGAQHFAIRKQVKNNSTRTQVLPLAIDQRQDELARMLGGTEITDATLALASDMLKRAV